MAMAASAKNRNVGFERLCFLYLDRHLQEINLALLFAQARLPPEVNRVLFIRNLPFNITSEEMYDIFGKYGAIRQIRMCVNTQLDVMFKE